MLRILIVGCGDIGLRAARLLRGKARVFGLLRTPERAGLLRAAGVMPILGDLDGAPALRRLAGLADIVLHFAPPPGDGVSDPRTRRLLSILNRSSLPRCLVYVSTSGVYGDCGGASIDETRPVRPHNARAKRRVDAEDNLRNWGKRTGVRVSILRAPGIYAEDRMPEERVRKGLPALRPDEDIYTNHIHAEDLARLAVHAAFRGAPGRVYHAVDDSGLKMGDWFDVVADHLGLARPPRLAKAEVMAAVTPAMRSFLTESRRLSNRRIKSELGFVLCHTDVRAVLVQRPGTEENNAEGR